MRHVQYNSDSLADLQYDLAYWASAISLAWFSVEDEWGAQSCRSVPATAFKVILSEASAYAQSKKELYICSPDPLGEATNVSVDPGCVSTAETPTYNSDLQSWSDQGNLMICDDVENGLGIHDNPRLDQLGRVRAKRAEKRSSPIPGASVRTSLTNAMVTIQPDQTSPEESHIDQMMTCPAQSIEVSSRKLFPSLAACNVISLANYCFFQLLDF